MQIIRMCVVNLFMKQKPNKFAQSKLYMKERHRHRHTQEYTGIHSYTQGHAGIHRDIHAHTAIHSHT